MRAREVAVLTACALTLGAGAARAYRPFDLTDADVAKRHNFEIALGPAELLGAGAEHSLRAPNLSVNYGLATGRELSLEGANRVALRAGPDEQHMQLEGIALAMKQVLRRGGLQDEQGLSIAMESAVLVPDRGEHHLGAGAGLIASSSSRRGATHVNIGAERLPEGLDAGSAGVIFEASDYFGVAPAIELRVEAVKGTSPEHSAIVGLIYVPGAETEYDVALRFARSGDERSFEIRAGLTWQMSAHKVLEQAAAAVGLPKPHRRRH